MASIQVITWVLQVKDIKRELIHDLMVMADELPDMKQRKPTVNFPSGATIPPCHLRFTHDKEHQHLPDPLEYKKLCVCHNIRKNTKVQCSTCQVPLCLPCYKRFHTKQDYLAPSSAAGSRGIVTYLKSNA